METTSRRCKCCSFSQRQQQQQGFQKWHLRAQISELGIVLGIPNWWHPVPVQGWWWQICHKFLQWRSDHIIQTEDNKNTKECGCERQQIRKMPKSILNFTWKNKTKKANKTKQNKTVSSLNCCHQEKINKYIYEKSRKKTNN